MMSQMEIRNMQDYCLRRNYEQDRREKQETVSLATIAIFIMCLVIFAISVMLTAYVLWASVAMTGTAFLVTGIAGTAAGAAAMALASMLNLVKQEERHEILGSKRIRKRTQRRIRSLAGFTEIGDAACS